MKRNLLLLAAACMLVANAASAATYFYGSGAGPWDTATASWSTSDVAPWTGSTWVDGNAATLTGTPGILTIPTGETRDISGLTFTVAGYDITGGTLNLNNSTSPVTIASNISNINKISSTITGSYGLTVNNSNAFYILSLTNANTYSGITTLTRGNLKIYNGNALGAAGAGNHTVIGAANTGRLDLLTPDTNTMTIGENFTLNGTGYSGSGAIMALYTADTSNNFVLNGDMNLSTSADTAFGAQYGTSMTFNGNVTLGGKLYLSGRGQGFAAAGGPLLPDSVMTFNGDISGAGQLLEYSYNTQNYALATAPTSITHKGVGTCVLAGNNSYNGITTIGTVSGSYHAIYVIKSNTALGNTTGATTVVNRSSLHIDGSAGSLSVAENITINGQGAPVFTGLDYYSTSTATYTSVAYDHGAIRNLAGNNTLSGNITLGSASRIDSDQDVLTLGGQISGNFALTIGGAGAVAINGTSAAGTSINVLSGATLAGTGTINGATTVAAGGYIMPGLDGTAGTLTMKALTLSTDAKLAFDLGPIAASDLISMSGSTLTINNLDLTNIDFNILAGAGAGVYTLIDAGTISGSLGGNLSTDYMGFTATLSIDTGANDLILTVTAVPEPGTLALLAAGLVGLLAYAWRKRK